MYENCSRHPAIVYTMHKKVHLKIKPVIRSKSRTLHKSISHQGNNKQNQIFK